MTLFVNETSRSLTMWENFKYWFSEISFRHVICRHTWEIKESTPGYYCHILSVFALPSSYLGGRYLVKWGFTCSKCGKWKVFEWFVHGKGTEKELCPSCRLYVSASKGTQLKTHKEYSMEITISEDVAHCHNCGHETFNEERWRSNRTKAFLVYWDRARK